MGGPPLTRPALPISRAISAPLGPSRPLSAPLGSSRLISSSRPPPHRPSSRPSSPRRPTRRARTARTPSFECGGAHRTVWLRVGGHAQLPQGLHEPTAGRLAGQRVAPERRPAGQLRGLYVRPQHQRRQRHRRGGGKAAARGQRPGRPARLKRRGVGGSRAGRRPPQVLRCGGGALLRAVRPCVASSALGSLLVCLPWRAGQRSESRGRRSTEHRRKVGSEAHTKLVLVHFSKRT